MNDIVVFNNKDFGEIRTLYVDDEVWFVGKDVALALGYKDTDQALRQHVDEEDKLTRKLNGSGQKRSMVTINESGLYSLVLSSKLPSAREFKHWVTSEVLPAIRKTGAYQIPQKPSAEITALRAQLWRDLADRVEVPEYKQICYAYMSKELAGNFALPLPESTRATYSATEIGKELGITGNMVGRISTKLGLKIAEYGKWFIDKSKYSSKEVETFRYYDNVLPIIRAYLVGDIDG